MPETDKVRELIERATREVVAHHVESLQHEIVARLSSEFESVFSSNDRVLALSESVAGIRRAGNQSDALIALLEGVAHVSSRCGLFVVRGAVAIGWQSRGIAETDTFRRCSLNCSSGMVAQAISRRVPVVGRAQDIDPTLANKLHTQASHGALMPIVIRDRVVALLYAEGTEPLELPSIELLVHTAEMSLDLQSLRKNAPESAPQSAQQPSHSATAVASASVQTTPAPVTPAPAAIASLASTTPVTEDEIHLKARRFAKLLAEEIRLYNQTKVQEGRAKRDLYDRLRVDIEKSRAAYEKRYGEVVRDCDYFTQELVRILAEGDRSLLGSNFPG